MAQACYEIPWPPSKTTGVGKTLSRPQEEESWKHQAFAVEGVPTSSMPTSTPAWGFGWLLWVFLMGCIVTKQSGGAYRETEGWSLAPAPWSWEQGIPGHSPGFLWYPMAQAGAGITYSTAGIPGTHLIRSFSTTLSYCTKALIRTLSTLLFTLVLEQQLNSSYRHRTSGRDCQGQTENGISLMCCENHCERPLLPHSLLSFCIDNCEQQRENPKIAPGWSKSSLLMDVWP